MFCYSVGVVIIIVVTGGTVVGVALVGGTIVNRGAIPEVEGVT